MDWEDIQLDVVEEPNKPSKFNITQKEKDLRLT